MKCLDQNIEGVYLIEQLQHLYYHSDIYNIIKDSAINYKDSYFKYTLPFELEVISEKYSNCTFFDLNRK